MGTPHFKILRLLLAVTLMKICAAQNDMTLSVFTVTSRSMTVQWTPVTGATFYGVKATPKNSPQGQGFIEYGQNTIIGSITSLTPDTPYTVQVEAMDNQRTIIASVEADALTAPDIPTISLGYSKTSESITVEFPEVPGATGYMIRAETGTFFSEALVSGSPGTIQGLQPYTEYEISIMSVNAGGRSQPSYSIDRRTVIVAPSLNTSSPTSTSIEATWEPVDHAVEYTFVIIEEATMKRFDINTSQTILKLNNLRPGTNYTIKVQALDAEGRPGDAQTFSQITRPAPPQVIDVRVEPLSRSGTKVFWLPVPGAGNYTVTTSDNQTCNSTFHSFCDIRPVFCGQNETVIVLAYNDAGASNPSKPAEFLTYPCPPNNTFVEEYGPGNCSVVWDEVPVVQYYMAYVKWNNGQEKICNTTGTTCMFECACGYTFVVFVIPYNKVGSSPVIELINYTTAPCCPDNVNVTLVSTETVEIEWTEGRGAELYQVTAEETNDIIHCNDTEPLCALSDLECDTTYSIKVTPCSELSGCNETCTAQTQVTAPCAPEVNDIIQVTSSTYLVQFSTPNREGTTYTITATASDGDTYTCESSDDSCNLTDLPCGTIFKVTGVAESTSGESLVGYEKTLETGPCCPDSCEVTQETQAMTKVSWSSAVGARSFITSLTSQRGAAKCHTVDNHCLMGCITCSTNYTVTMEAISSTGHISECSYQGFSSSPCCPTHVKLYTIPNNHTLNFRVSWRPQSAPLYRHSVEVTGNGASLTCNTAPGQKFCDVVGANCGVAYTVLVAPVLHNGTKASFCQERTYSGSLMPCPPSGQMMVGHSHG